MKAIKREPAASLRAAEEIRIAILNGALSPGTRVRQEELAEQLGLSRVPIRQALAILEQQGLVHNTLRRGAVIAPIDSSFISDVYEVREIVESYAAARAAEIGFDLKPLLEVVRLGRRAVKADKVEDLVELDWRFHSGLYEASGNQVLVKTMQAQWVHVRRAMFVTIASLRDRSRIFWDEHQAILNAIGKRDARLASKLASEHVRSAKCSIVGNIFPSSGDAE
jgi:DNA-binding GntR family transcriptional regulator